MLPSFSILQTGREVMFAKGNRAIDVVRGKEEYATLKESFSGIFQYLNGMFSEGEINIGTQKN